MDFSRVLCTRRNEYTFKNGERSSVEHRQPPVLVALVANRQPLTEIEREARQAEAARRRTQAILRAAERDLEQQRREQELQAVRRSEIQEAATEIVNREIHNLRTEFLAEINRIRESEEVEFIPIMPAPMGEVGGMFLASSATIIYFFIARYYFHCCLYS